MLQWLASRDEAEHVLLHCRSLIDAKVVVIARNMLGKLVEAHAQRRRIAVERARSERFAKRTPQFKLKPNLGHKLPSKQHAGRAVKDNSLLLQQVSSSQNNTPADRADSLPLE